MENDIVEFARKNGAFRNIVPDDLQYIGDIGDNAHQLTDISVHELMFEDMYGYIRTWSFKVETQTGEIIPYEGGFKFEISGFNPNEMRKKLAVIDKVHKEDHDETI